MIFKVLVSISALSMVALSSANFIFGYSGGADNQLDVELSDGSHFISSTSWSPFTSGIKNQGWWSASNGNTDDNDNTFAGDYGTGPLNDFFTFDVANLDLSTNSIVAMTLVANTYGIDGGVKFLLHDVSTDAATLNFNNGINAGIANDLATGNLYGSYIFGPGDSYTVTNFSLSGLAISDLTAAKSGGANFFSVGGTTEAVPEPMSMAVLGLGAVALLRRRKKA